MGNLSGSSEDPAARRASSNTPSRISPTADRWRGIASEIFHLCPVIGYIDPMSWVLFFDCDCAFCSASVRRAFTFDKHRRLKYSPLQGKLAAEKGFSSYADKSGGTMVVLRESDGEVFLRSDAAIEIARALGGGWRIFSLAALIPRSIRDGVYQWIARHRYWFSSTGDFCLLPDPEMQKQILE